MPTRVLARKGRAASAKKGPGAGTTASYTAFAKTGKGARRNSSNSKTKSKSNSKISSLKKSKSLLSGKAQAGKKAKKSSKSILKKMSAKVDLKKIGKKVVKKVLAKKKVAKKGAKKVLTKKSNSTKAKGKVAAAKVAKPAMRSKASSSSSAAPKVNKAKKPKVEEIDLHEAIRRRNIPRIKELIEVNWSSVRRRRLAKVIEPQGTPLDVAIDMNDFEVVKMLFDAGSWDLICDYKQENSLLIRCLTTARLELTRHVIERGADVHNDNHIPNMIAVACYAVDQEYVQTWDKMSGLTLQQRYDKYHHLIDLLVEKGAQVGDMEWFYAVNHGYLPVVQSFLRHGKMFPEKIRIELQNWQPGIVPAPIPDNNEVQYMNIVEYAERMRRFDVANCLRKHILDTFTKPFPAPDKVPESCRDRDCAICFDPIKEGENVSILKCGHPFHYECLLPIVENRNACCPYCRQKINTV